VGYNEVAISSTRMSALTFLCFECFEARAYIKNVFPPNEKRRMFVESKFVLSLLALVILFLSFVASFKHQNSFIFVVGLLVCIIITRTDSWAPVIREAMSKFGSTDAEQTAAAEKATEKAAEKKPEPPKYHGAPLLNPEEKIDATVARDLLSANINKLEELNTSPAFAFGRPTMGDFISGNAKPKDLLKLVPDFPSMGHMLVGTLRDPSQPFLSDDGVTQNPDVKALEKHGLVAAPDYFPNCKTGSVVQTSDARDPRDTLRCNRPGIY
jgi:hypothetical protein